MKNFKILILVVIILSGFSTNAFQVSNLNNIKMVQLFDGSTIDFIKDVEEIQFASDRSNLVDFIQLKEGTVIDSYDIKKLIFKTIEIEGYVSPSNHGIMISTRRGDGSGG